MNDENEHSLPSVWPEIRRQTLAMGFDMPSEARTAALLTVLAASKPGGRFLELGTGTGLATAALLAGMSHDAELVTVDVDATVQDVARRALGHDDRITFRLEDGLAYIESQPPRSFDLVFADAMPGKYEGLEEALRLVREGGIYIGDDMLPQDNWPEGHQHRVNGLVHQLQALKDWSMMSIAWGSGYVVAVRRGDL